MCVVHGHHTILIIEPLAVQVGHTDSIGGPGRSHLVCKSATA